MLKEVTARAHFLRPIHHNEELTSFTGLRADWFIEAILFNNESCEYDASEESDGSLVMHDITFSDGSTCYFEVSSDGTLSHFMANAFLEFRDGLLVVSPRAAYEEAKRELDHELSTVHRRN
jgi:hypothetical protein